MQKLYCYVDESGQDTMGEMFLVAVVIADEVRKELRDKLKEIELSSKKRIKKWTKSTLIQREEYMKQIINNKEFIGRIYYSHYKNTREYVDLTILSTTKAIHNKARLPYQATIFVDGLGRNERSRFGSGLRKLKVKVKKVRGIKDQSDEFIRLADAIAGLIRDVLENKNKTLNILHGKAKQNRIIKEI